MTLSELKQRGHSLLDRYCKEKGRSKGQAYTTLYRKLGVSPQKAHFSEMYTKAEVHGAISAIEKMIAYKKQVSKPSKQILPLQKQREILANMHQRPTFFIRLRNLFFN